MKEMKKKMCQNCILRKNFFLFLIAKNRKSTRMYRKNVVERKKRKKEILNNATIFPGSMKEIWRGPPFLDVVEGTRLMANGYTQSFVDV